MRKSQLERMRKIPEIRLSRKTISAAAPVTIEIQRSPNGALRTRIGQRIVHPDSPKNSAFIVRLAISRESRLIGSWVGYCNVATKVM
ncbi:hypothetical protein OPQ81_011956 [Rhizoctonia solani]|nr:hypothetical protein OPQ81_011956 [Rhizoctonia solani]